MAKDDLPDAPWAQQDNLPDAPWAKEESAFDPGFLAGAGRAARGFATGVETTVDSLAKHLPFSDPKLIEETLAKRPKPTDPVEKAANVAGEIAPSFAIPTTGLGGVATQALGRWPTIARIAGATAEGGVQGGLGGMMLPEGDRASNTDIGTAAGMAARGGTAALDVAWNAIRPAYRHAANAIAAGFATKAMEHMGMPNDWLVRAPVFFTLWRASLLDLANKWAGRAGKQAGPIGATAAEGMNSNGRTD